MDFHDLADGLTGTELSLAGSDRLDLRAAGRAWYVRSGRMVVFASRRGSNGLPGARSFLFEVGPGEVLFGLGAHDSLVLEASPIEPTRALAFWPGALEALDGPHQDVARSALEAWIERLSEPLVESAPGIQPIGLEGPGPFSLPEGQTCRPRDPMAWCAVQAGEASWLGLAPSLDEKTGAFPVASRLWLRAEAPLELVVCDRQKLALGELGLGIRAYYRFVMGQLGVLVDRADRAHEARLHRQVAHERRGREAALRELAGMLEAPRAALDLSGAPIVAAARVVGRALGVSISAPSGSEADLPAMRMAAAIARASRLRSRTVLLEGRFWRQDAGPLLAFVQEGMVPVALLRESAGRYVIFDPRTRARTLVTDESAGALHHLAVMFYRPLPESRVGLMGLVRFTASGRGRDLLYLLAVGLLGALLGMFLPFAMGVLIDQAVPDSNRAMLLQLGGGLLATAIGMAVFQVCQGVLTLRMETIADATVQAAVWDRVLSLGAPFFKRYSVGDLNARAMAISQIRQKLSGTTLRTILAGVFSLLNFGLMFLYDVSLALVAVGLALVAFAVTFVHCTLKLRRTRPLRRLEGAILGQVVQLVGGVNKLRVTGAEGRAFGQWSRAYRDKQALLTGIQATENSLAVFNQVFPGFSAVVIFYLAYKGMAAGSATGAAGLLSTGMFLAFNAAFGSFLTGAMALSNTLIDLLDIGDLWHRAKPLIEEPLEVTSAKRDPGTLGGAFALDRVSFRYEGTDRQILNDLSLHADPGEHIALVGTSGCGKSTILRLLLGFEGPESGVISFDGQDMARLDLRAIRRQMGVVLQTARLMAGSVFENVACGALISYDEAWEAVRQAGMEDDIRRMPMALHTMVAEGGTNLSGGQRQRLLLARAFALQPKIMLLDEATSALDNQTQAIVAASLKQSRITRVSIAHRLSTVRDADRIYVLDAGRVVEEGTFDALLARGGLFARLAAYQSL